MAALGDERLFALLEADGRGDRPGRRRCVRVGRRRRGVERAAWAKVVVVTADEREQGAAEGRISLNLGHSLGHAVEAAGGFGDLLHGEAVAVGLRAAARIGVELEVTPAGAERPGSRASSRAGARRRSRSPTRSTRCSGRSRTDKKHADGPLRWVLPTADGYEVRADVPAELVERVAAGLLAPVGAGLAGRP